MYLLLDLINYIQSSDLKSAKTRIKQYDYIAEPKFIMNLLNYIKVNL